MKLAAVSTVVVLASLGGAAGACPCKEGDLVYSDDEARQCASYVSPNQSIRPCIEWVRSEAARIKRQNEEAVAGAARYAEKRQKEEDALVAARQSRAKAEADEADERERLSSNPDWMLPALSALLCYDAWLYRRSVAEIKTEQSYAKRGGGMIDKGKIYELQRHMRHANESRDEARAQILMMRRRPLPCGSKAIAEIVDCMQDSRAESCGTDDVRDRITFVDVPEGPTWSCRGFNCD